MDLEDGTCYDRFKLDFDSTLWQIAARMKPVGTEEDERPCDSAYRLIINELLGFSGCLPNPPEEFSEEALKIRFLGYLAECESPAVSAIQVDVLMQATYLAKYRYLDDVENQAVA